MRAIAHDPDLIPTDPYSTAKDPLIESLYLAKIDKPVSPSGTVSTDQPALDHESTTHGTRELGHEKTQIHWVKKR